MFNRKNMITLTLAAALYSASATAQTWTLVSSSNPALPTPGLPEGVSVQPFEVAQNDSDGNSVRIQINQNESYGGRWLKLGVNFQPTARINVTGSLGPNRGGAEADHRFLSMPQFSDAGPNGTLAFLASAGPTGGSGSSSGLWLWQNGQNQELARYGTAGVLGPGLGANWQFIDTNVSSMALNVGPNGVALSQSVSTPTNQTRAALVLLRAGGNVPCMVQADTSAAFGPNIGAGSSFAFGTYAAARHGSQYFVNATAEFSGFFEGIWEVCSAAPRPIALAGRIGNLGPDVGSLSARFTTIRTAPRPHVNNAQVFIASYRFDDSAPNRGALWRHRAGSNRLLAQTGDSSAALGPNYQGASFEFLDNVNASFDSADGHVAFETSALTPAATRINGLWRIRPGGNPEAIALEGQPGSVSPGVGQTFAQINRWKLFGNGDLVADCVVSGGPSGLYLFQIGRLPRLLLTGGQNIALQIGTTSASATVQSFTLVGTDNASSESSYGPDSWVSNDGAIVVSATIVSGANAGQVLMSLKATDLSRIFADGFEN
jgi:hypothetical protein